MASDPGETLGYTADGGDVTIVCSFEALGSVRTHNRLSTQRKIPTHALLITWEKKERGFGCTLQTWMGV